MTNELKKQILKAANYNNAVINGCLRGDLIHEIFEAEECEARYEIVTVDNIKYAVTVEC